MKFGLKFLKTLQIAEQKTQNSHSNNIICTLQAFKSDTSIADIISKLASLIQLTDISNIWWCKEVSEVIDMAIALSSDGVFFNELKKKQRIEIVLRGWNIVKLCFLALSLYYRLSSLHSYSWMCIVFVFTVLLFWYIYHIGCGPCYRHFQTMLSSLSLSTSEVIEVSCVWAIQTICYKGHS